MRRPATALAVLALLSTGLAACGGDASETSDIVPRSTPDLVAPENTGLPPATGGGDDEDAGTSTSTTSTTETTPEGTDTSAAPVTPATPTPATPAPQEAPEAGGQQAPAQTQPPEGGGTSGGNSGGFSDFCAENPGACPEE